MSASLGGRGGKGGKKKVWADTAAFQAFLRFMSSCCADEKGRDKRERREGGPPNRCPPLPSPVCSRKATKPMPINTRGGEKRGGEKGKKGGGGRRGEEQKPLPLVTSSIMDQAPWQERGKGKKEKRGKSRNRFVFCAPVSQGGGGRKKPPPKKGTTRRASIIVCLAISLRSPERGGKRGGGVASHELVTRTMP